MIMQSITDLTEGVYLDDDRHLIRVQNGALLHVTDDSWSLHSLSSCQDGTDEYKWEKSRFLPVPDALGDDEDNLWDWRTKVLASMGSKLYEALHSEKISQIVDSMGRHLARKKTTFKDVYRLNQEISQIEDKDLRSAVLNRMEQHYMSEVFQKALAAAPVLRSLAEDQDQRTEIPYHICHAVPGMSEQTYNNWRNSGRPNPRAEHLAKMLIEKGPF